MLDLFRTRHKEREQATFRIRSGGRDQATDRGRIDRLVSKLDQLVLECDAEAQGLRERRSDAQQNASLLSFAMDAESMSSKQEQSMRNFEASMKHCEARLRQISEHRQFFSGLLDEVRRTAPSAASPIA